MSRRHYSTASSLFPLVALVLFLSALIIALYFYWYSFCQNHFAPHTSLNNIDISYLSSEQALAKLAPLQIPSDQKVILYAADQKITSSSAQLSLRYNFPSYLQEMLLTQRQELLQNNLLSSLLPFYQRQYTLEPQFSSSALSHMIASLAQRIDQPGKPGYLLLGKTNQSQSLILEKGQDSLFLDQQSAYQTVSQNISRQTEFHLPVQEQKLAYSDQQLNKLREQALLVLGKKLSFTTSQIDNFSFTLQDTDLVPLLGASSSTQLSLKQSFAETVKKDVAREAQEPILEIKEKKVVQFTPPLDGLDLNQAQFFLTLDSGVQQLLATDSGKLLEVDIPLTTTKPQKSLASTNDLGINELIGFGESYYAHSIAGRVHNVALTASKLNNTLVAPGEEFSFNKVIGDVSAAAGYKNGYVIKGGRSELSAGGGVCQVSTTLFRALLDSGLKITLRRPHSYRVSYYELSNDPGFDATVYSGNVDLRFINDTDNYVLISSQADSDNLYMTVKLWGTSDGRSATITNYKKFNAKAAPATQYIPDSSIPPGTKKQIDWAVGGLQTNFTHTIYNADGTIRSQKDYPSTYQAWSAKYLVGP